MKKRVLAVILTVVLAISMAACANSRYAEYETLINYLEEDDYQAAYIELVRLADEYKKSNSDNADNSDNSGDNADNGDNTDGEENKEDEVHRDWEGALIISREEFLSYCEVVILQWTTGKIILKII